jgi:hypothetical protein
MTSEIVDENRVSIHCVGVFPSGRIYVQRLNEQRVWNDLDNFGVRSVLIWLCINAIDDAAPDEPATLVGVIRTQREGEDIQHYHTYIPSDIRHEGEYFPTDKEILVMQNGLLYVIAAERNPENPEREMQAIAEDVRVMESLGVEESA